MKDYQNQPTKICQNPECKKEYSPTTFNQKYCSKECTRKVTNKNIMSRYYDKKAIRAGKRRICEFKTCSTVLSRYNDTEYCSIHAHGLSTKLRID